MTVENQIKVLLVEDDEEDFLLTQDIMQDIPGSKYKLEWAATFEDGLKAILRNEYDICLVDYRLGKEDGLKLLQLAAEREMDSPFIMLTGHNDRKLDIQAMKSGAADFLVKGQLNGDLVDRAIRYAIQLKKTVKRLRQNQELLSEAQSLAHLGHFNWHVQTGTILWSDEHYRIFGLEPQSEPITYDKFLEFVVPGDIPKMNNLMKFLLNMGDYEDIDYQIKIPGQAIKYLHGKAKAERTSKGELVRITGTTQDISERVENEKKLSDYAEIIKQNDEDLEQKVADRTKKLTKSETNLKRTLGKERELSELKSRFVSMASHEFRTPLSSILSSAGLIEMYKEKGQTDNMQKHIERIQSSVQNLTTILDDFLSLEKLESGTVAFTPEQLDFPLYIKEIRNEVKGMSQKKQKVIHQHVGRSTVYIDPHLVKNILLNLLSNAVKYSPEGTNIELISELKNDQLFIDVCDQGIGIPEEDQKHMFSRFFRATNVANIKGTGLGLTIVKRYIDLMDGDINFTSKPGEGTTFKVVIPVA